ncbi:hypothetical protein AB0D27_11115 [Streptomyces sp. NPDC048415]|uniref:hypothetical protein n=1 Tax=Streptomyces sp. NPDC048415 TaxID=3154822 RepID=UPI00343E94B2
MTDTERAAYIRSVVDSAPCPSAEDADRVRALLPLRGCTVTRRRRVRGKAA